MTDWEEEDQKLLDRIVDFLLVSNVQQKVYFIEKTTLRVKRLIREERAKVLDELLEKARERKQSLSNEFESDVPSIWLIHLEDIVEELKK